MTEKIHKYIRNKVGYESPPVNHNLESINNF